MFSKGQPKMKRGTSLNAHFWVAGYFCHGMLRRTPRKMRGNATLCKTVEDKEKERQGKAHGN